VRYVELDLGQPRFNLPGLVALYELDSPLFTHQNNFVSLFKERVYSKFIGKNTNFNCVQEYVNASKTAIVYGKDML
jgi:polynucleotide 5'-kinase involved in rRNA processing